MLTGLKLRRIRLHLGLTLNEMRDIVGVKSRKTVMNWEKNKGSPSVNQVLAIMSVTGFTPEEFFQFLNE